ncbi:HTTM domain-containing protein [Kitasatospora sp. NPDC088346]|uniref:HTTM domain-containing protein n=1 Tax=Kitasatospora sp. NPDC088346 TaxID=3364073 RepID=UPI0037F7C2EA
MSGPIPDRATDRQLLVGIPPQAVPQDGTDGGTDAAAGPGPVRTGPPPPRFERLFDAFTARTWLPRQAAVVRIGTALAWGGFLLREWPNRRELYGDRSPWSAELADRMLGETHAFTVLAWSHSHLWFEVVYHLGILAAVLLGLGWRTRASSLLFAVTALSLQNRNVLVGDGGDNVVHLMAIYLVLVRCGRAWSLDARRARRRPPRGPVGEPRAVLDALATMLHNCGLLVIAGQVVLIYSTAGWYKVQGSRWQDGTALHYPLHLDYFTPWPGLSGLLGSSLLVTFLLSYGTVVLQVGFPFTLANRRLKNALLALMMAEHVAIAVTLGLPFFSLAMIAADAVFLPTGALLWAERRVRHGLSRGRPGREGDPALAQAPAPARTAADRAERGSPDRVPDEG